MIDRTTRYFMKLFAAVVLSMLFGRLLGMWIVFYGLR